MGDTAGDQGVDSSPRKAFTRQFNRLWERAGSPVLDRVARTANQREAAARGHAGTVTTQRLSDWRAGAIPARWEVLRPALLTLIDLAKHAQGRPPAGLLNLRDWQRLWSEANAWKPPEDPHCPYQGLAPYFSGDAERFFGRERATDDLVALVRSTDRAGGGIVVVFGASGAGKSSLLAAGLIPALGPEWTTTTSTPDPDLAAIEIPSDRGGRRLMVVDQFEELFTAAIGDNTRRAFIDRLPRCADQGVTVVIAVRADFFAPCLDYPVLANAITKRPFLLSAMSSDELTDAIIKPAAMAELKLEPGLVELILTELSGLGDVTDGDSSGALPLLSHVMEAAWHRRKGRKLSVDGYRAAGGVAGSVAHTADTAWQKLDDSQQTASKDMLLQMVTVGHDTRDTRRRVARVDLLAHTSDPDAAATALETLAQARLITLDTDAAILTHEVVIDAWPELRKWIDADREGHLVRQRVAADAAEWSASQRNRALLYRGARLAQAREHQPRPTGQTGEFLIAGIRQHRRRIAAQVGLAAAVVVLLVAALTSIVRADITSRERDEVFFTTVLSEADRLQNSEPTLSAELSLLAQRLRPGSPDAAARLVASQNLPVARTFADHDGEVTGLVYLDNGLLVTAGDDHVIRVRDPATIALTAMITDHTSQITSLDGHGSTLIAGSADHTARIYDLSAPEQPRLLHVLDTGSPITSLALSRDGRSVAIANDDRVTLWDITDPQTAKPRSPSLTVGETVYGVGFSGNDKTLLTGSGTAPGSFVQTLTARLWDLDAAPGTHTGTQVAQVVEGRMVLDFSASTPLLVAGGRWPSQPPGSDAEIRFLNIEDPHHPTPAAASFPVRSAYDLISTILSPDSRTLATVTSFGTQLWNLADLAHPSPLGPPLTAAATCLGASGNRRCSTKPAGAAFSPDGRTFTIATVGGTVQQWSLPSTTPAGQAGQIQPPAVSADGTRMITTAHGAAARIWDIHDPAAPQLRGTVDNVTEIAGASTIVPVVSFDGRFAALSINGVITLLDISDPGKPRATHRFPESAAVAFALDQQMLVTLSRGPVMSLTVWDYANPDRPVQRSAAIVVPSSGRLLRTGFRFAASRDGKIGATLADKLNLWDTPLSPEHATGPIGTTTADRLGDGGGLAVSPDHRTVVAGWDAGTARIFDITDPGTIRPLGDPLAASRSAVTSVDISPDGRRLATAGTDSTVRLWTFTDPERPSPYGPSLTPPGSGRWHVAFHPKANYLIGTGGQGAVRLWDLEPEHAARRICTLTATTITTDLSTYLPGRKLPPLCP
ncbi:NACHT and WD repeat domain-containing protein [Nocardia altamirensis]|uniref:NACHT and WD repeat domain-containing protein n=1 Tax=Nocardia altamirensis TaxID=472158 RepID=UPI00083FE62C|nr:AAA family ATPase [Nocardia altamirensis]